MSRPAMRAPLRTPVPAPPVPNGYHDEQQYEGVEPEDDYSDFNAWGDDFGEEEVDNQDAGRQERPAQGRGMSHFGNGRGAVPLPPGGRQAAPPPSGHGAPPPSLPPRSGGHGGHGGHGGGRSQPMPEPVQEAAPLPPLPSRHGMPAPSRNAHDDDDDDDDCCGDYLEPALPQQHEPEEINDTYLDPSNANDLETYEDPNLTLADHHSSQTFAQEELLYQEPDEVISSREIYYEEADNKGVSTRPPAQPSRQWKPSGPPSQPVPSPPADEDGDTYDNPDDVTDEIRRNPRMDFRSPQQLPGMGGKPPPVLSQRALPPQPELNNNAPNKPNRVANKPPKLMDTMVLRNKKTGLRPVDQIFPQPVQNDDEDDDIPCGVAEIKARLAKNKHNSPMFASSEHSTQRIEPQQMAQHRPDPRRPAERVLPQLPVEPRVSSSSSHGSDDNSSGGGTFGGIRPGDRALPPPPTEVASPTISKPMVTDVTNEYWYHDIERTAVISVMENTKDGRFLVRPSKLGGPQAPYTLCVYNKNRLFNLNIRHRDDNRYALGTVHPNEKTFISVAEMINYHKSCPITLAGKEKGHVTLSDHPFPSLDEIYDLTET